MHIPIQKTQPPPEATTMSAYSTIPEGSARCSSGGPCHSHCTDRPGGLCLKWKPSSPSWLAVRGHRARPGVSPCPCRARGGATAAAASAARPALPCAPQRGRGSGSALSLHPPSSTAEKHHLLTGMHGNDLPELNK